METHETLSPTDKICAIDLGLKDFPVVVDGMRNIQRIPHPKWLAKIEKRIKKEQRKLARKQKVSKNREKQKLKLAKLYEKLKNQERGPFYTSYPKLSSARIKRWWRS
ncbi:MAG: transposase [Candidatus Aenigmatarchaeota archaeon]